MLVVLEIVLAKARVFLNFPLAIKYTSRYRMTQARAFNSWDNSCIVK